MGPVPFSKDGVHLNTGSDLSLPLSQLGESLRPGQILAGGAIPREFADSLGASQITVVDLMQDENFLQENASFTAEGLLASLIYETPFSLRGKRLLLLGCGRCGKELCRLFVPITQDAPGGQSPQDIPGGQTPGAVFPGLSITVCDRDPAALLWARERGIAAFLPGELMLRKLDFDLVVNTIPAPLLTEESLRRLPSHCVLFDIASAPFGFSPKDINKRPLKLVRCPGIPGKTMPKTAGEAMGKILIERILSYGL